MGLAARFGLSGAVADAAGGVLYSVLVYVVIAFASPTLRSTTVGGAAFAWSAAIELFQLTPVPADLGDWFPPLHLALGASFVATDLIAYAVGAGFAAWLDARLRTRRHR